MRRDPTSKNKHLVARNAPILAAWGPENGVRGATDLLKNTNINKLTFNLNNNTRSYREV